MPDPVVDLLPLDLPGDAVRFSPHAKPVLLGSRGAVTGTTVFPPRSVSPADMDEEMMPVELPGSGRLYSFTRLHVGPQRWHKPLLVGYVDLDNGVRIFTHLRGSPDMLVIDARVRIAEGIVGTEPDGRPIRTFLFEPEGDSL
jgi:uncharacterized OB-fold protein